VSVQRRVAERPEAEVQVLLLELERLTQLRHPAVELHEGLAEPLDLLVRDPPPMRRRGRR
jgi:hypothetical protein